jgi:hypothetical protein
MPFMPPTTSSDPVSRWFYAARKRTAMRRYLRRLPKQLSEDYGHRGPYTPKQVEASIQRAKLSAEFAPYAQAIFCDEAALPTGGRHDFRAIRHELGGTYFENGGGGGDYTYSDVARYVGGHGGYESHGGGEGSGYGDGGHHGGDGGGHH